MVRHCRQTMGVGVIVLALVFPGFPLVTTIRWLWLDHGLRSAAPSTYAYALHRSLSRRIPEYVDERIASGKAEGLSISQVTATEWPVYGAFFYLLATDNLQRAWTRDHSLAAQAPAVTGTEAVEASVRIMLDKGHAHWIRTYWGDDYDKEPNCFYRMLMIGSLAAHHRLTGKAEHLPMLRQYVNDLVSHLNASPKGLIDDYPQQCFPCDVAAAIAMVLRADEALGTDHRPWVKAAFHRMLENFPDGIPPYMAQQRTGLSTSPSRGCTNGYFFTFAREIDSTSADHLYQKWVASFWQETRLAAGWREFERGSQYPDSHFDPDSGPVVGGFGTAASGLGLGAARVHADHERAGKLGAELIAAGVPLPDGSMLVPRLVSDREHAPWFAELAILHQLSLGNGERSNKNASIPGCVWLILGTEAALFVLLLRVAQWFLRGFKGRGNATTRAPADRAPHFPGNTGTGSKFPSGP